MSGDGEAWQDLLARFLVPAIMALGFLVLGYFIASFLGRIVGGQVSKRVDVTLGRFLAQVIKYGLMVLIFLSVLGYFGVDVTSFAAVIAAMGFAVGMALQGTLSNFAAGVMLLVFRPFKVGEFILVGGESGTVEQIDLFTTRINTPENLHVIVPNSQVFGATITNYSRNGTRRIEVTVGVDYTADLDRTRRVLEAALAEVPGVLNDPISEVYLSGLADSSVNWTMRAWSGTTDFRAVTERMMEAAKKGLDLNNIGIPFPQLDVHLTSEGEGKAA
ncbi:MAG: mechanosensitive ion channel family protein [Pirellulaceae bacterium]